MGLILDLSSTTQSRSFIPAVIYVFGLVCSLAIILSPARVSERMFGWIGDRFLLISGLQSLIGNKVRKMAQVHYYATIFNIPIGAGFLSAVEISGYLAGNLFIFVHKYTNVLDYSEHA